MVTNYPALIVAICAVCVAFIAPQFAVFTGQKLNERKARFNKKNDLFLTLFTLRGSQLDYRNVEALNQIEVIFADSSSVLNCWHVLHAKYSSKLSKDISENDLKSWDLARADLLFAMSSALGYKHLKQTDLMQHYLPQRHVDLEARSEEWQTASLAYYKIAHEMCQVTIDFHKGLSESKGEVQE